MGSSGFSSESSSFQLRVGALTVPARSGVGGVDVLLCHGQWPVAAGFGVKTAAPLRNLHSGSGVLVARVGHRGYLRGVQGVEDAVLAGGADVVP